MNVCRVGMLVTVGWLLLVGSATAAVPQAQPVWTVRAPSFVPVGENFVMSVSGPPGAPFSVNVTALPFNASQSIWYHAFALPFLSPNATNLNNTTLNFTIVSSQFLQGTYQLNISNGLGSVWRSTFLVRDPLNWSQVQQNLTNLSNAVNRDNGYVAQIGTTVANQDLTVELSVWTTVGIAIVAVNYMTIREALLRFPWWFKKRRENWHRALWSPHPFRTYLKALRDVPLVPVKDPPGLELFKCSYCPPTVATYTRLEVGHHLTTRHRISTPVEPRDFYPVRPTRVEQVKAKAAARPTREARRRRVEAARTIQWEE